MAKKASLVDKALEVSRKARVPKKPVKAKGKKTVPAALDWGAGIPEDKLAYLNDDEMALVQANRMFKGKRSVKGVPAFPDPGDTAAGGNSHLPDGGSGIGSGNKGGAGAGAGAGSSASKSGGTGGAGAAGGAGGAGKEQKTSVSTSAARTSGPDRGPTSGPARTAPSTVGTTNAQSNRSPLGGVGPSMAGADTMAYHGALDRIARGSSVIGNPSGMKQITDRVPQAPSAPSVKMSQEPSIPRASDGLRGSLTSGANSPFADESVGSYSVPSVSPQAPSTIGGVAASGLVGPSVPAGTAHLGPDAASFMGARYGSGVAPSVSPAVAAGTPSVPTKQYADRIPGSVTGVPDYSPPPRPQHPGRTTYLGDRYTTSYTPGDYASYRAGMAQAAPVASATAVPASAPPTAAKTYQDRLDVQTPYGSYSADQLSNMSAEDQAKLNALAQTPSFTPGPAPSGGMSIGQNISGVGNYSDAANAAGAVGSAAPSSMPSPATSYSGNVFRKNPAQQAADIRRAVALAQGPASARPSADGLQEVNISGYSPDVSPSQGDIPPSQQPAYDENPIQQSGWSDAQREAYLKTLEGMRNRPANISTQQMAMLGSLGSGNKSDKSAMPELPPWNYYDYLYTNYPANPYTADPDIVNFNRYSRRLNTGGSVGDSVDAALRLARHAVVSRAKTR